MKIAKSQLVKIILQEIKRTRKVHTRVGGKPFDVKTGRPLTYAAEKSCAERKECYEEHIKPMVDRGHTFSTETGQELAVLIAIATDAKIESPAVEKKWQDEMGDYVQSNPDASTKDVTTKFFDLKGDPEKAAKMQRLMQLGGLKEGKTMKITKQKLESLILEEIKSLQEGSPFQEKAKEDQNAWLTSRPWTASVLASFPERHMDEPVPHTLRRFLSSPGAAVVHEDYRSKWKERGHRVYDLGYIKDGGLQGDRGLKILKIIEDAFSFPLQPYIDGNAKVTPRENPLENDPLVSPPQFAKDPDGKRYITFTTKSGSWVVIDTPPGPSQDPQPGITIGRAPAEQGLTENKMKITKQQLKHIIKEEISNVLQEGMLDRFRGRAPSPADKEMERSTGFASHSAEETIVPEFHDAISNFTKDSTYRSHIIDELIDMAEEGELNILNLRQMSEEEKEAVVKSAWSVIQATYPDKSIRPDDLLKRGEQ